MESSVEHSSGEDTDVSDSETEEYVENAYGDLKNGKHQVKISDQAYTCPYCSKKKKRDFQYKDLLQHASAIGSCSSQKRNARDKGNHLALAKYLQSDIDAGPSKPSDEVDALADHDREEMFVWPWIGIVVNIPTHLKDGRYAGESGSKLRDQLASRGFNPTRVRPLWNYQGHSGTAIVEFRKDWSGFTNAMSFEKAYEANHHGRRNWLAKNEKKSSLYAWVARADDYNSSNIVGENIRKIGDLRTISDIMEEEARKTNKLVGNLTNVIEAKKMHLLEMENKFQETESSLSQLIMEKDNLHQAYNEEIKKIASSAQDHYRKIFNDHEKLKLQLETQKKDLELRGQELMKRQTHNENERKKLAEDLEQNAVKNCSLQAAAEEQRKADEKVMKLADEQKREKEKLHKKIILLEKQLDATQAVQLEIEQLRGKLNVVKHMGDEGDLEVLNKVEMLLKAMREKEEEAAELDSLNQTLIVQERMKNDELQDARKEMVNGLKEMSINSHIGVKRMGELDSQPFHRAMKRRYNEAEADERATELCSLWEEYLRDPEWHPINVVNINGKYQDDFMLRQPKLRIKHRESLVDWIFDVQRWCSLFDITAFAAVDIFDRFLSAQIVSKEEVDYVAAAAIHIATKYHETQIYKFMSLDELVQWVNRELPDPHGLHRHRARIMERRILEELGWELEVPTVGTFLTGFLDAAENPLDSTTEKMAYFFANLGVWNYDLMIAFPPEMLAAAALYTACEYTSNTSMWRDKLEDFTGFKDTQLVTCSKRMLALHMVGNSHKKCNWWVPFNGDT